MQAVRTYLEMRDANALRPARIDDPTVRIEQVRNCPVSFWRYLYGEVGRQYHWVDRLVWTDAQVREYLDDPAVSLWLLTVDGAPAGYFELKRDGVGGVEIAYFGLLKEFLGRGLGRHLLTEAVDRAWALGATRVWLHTCTLDHPAAVPNYLARGFSVYKKEEYTAPI